MRLLPVLLDARRAQSGKATLVDGILPERQFLDRSACSGCRLSFKRKKSAPHGGNHLGLASNDPPLGTRCRQIWQSLNGLPTRSDHHVFRPWSKGSDIWMNLRAPNDQTRGKPHVPGFKIECRSPFCNSGMVVPRDLASRPREMPRSAVRCQSEMPRGQTIVRDAGRPGSWLQAWLPPPTPGYRCPCWWGAPDYRRRQACRRGAVFLIQLYRWHCCAGIDSGCQPFWLVCGRLNCTQAVRGSESGQRCRERSSAGASRRRISRLFRKVNDQSRCHLPSAIQRIRAASVEVKRVQRGSGRIQRLFRMAWTHPDHGPATGMAAAGSAVGEGVGLVVVAAGAIRPLEPSGDCGVLSVCALPGCATPPPGVSAAAASRCRAGISRACRVMSSIRLVDPARSLFESPLGSMLGSTFEFELSSGVALPSVGWLSVARWRARLAVAPGLPAVLPDRASAALRCPAPLGEIRPCWAG